MRKTSPALIFAFGFGSFFCQCNSINSIQSPFKGSIENPICSDGAYAQRLYLRRLRTQAGHPIKYEREPPIVGADQVILDPYLIWQADQSFLSLHFLNRSESILDSNKASSIGQTRIYMNLYKANCVENQAPPSFQLVNSVE